MAALHRGRVSQVDVFISTWIKWRVHIVRYEISPLWAAGRQTGLVCRCTDSFNRDSGLRCKVSVRQLLNRFHFCPHSFWNYMIHQKQISQFQMETSLFCYQSSQICAGKCRKVWFFFFSYLFSSEQILTSDLPILYQVCSSFTLICCKQAGQCFLPLARQSMTSFTQSDCGMRKNKIIHIS